jgi:hypothetical protein
MFETGGVPISAIRSGGATSGIQLAIEYKPLADIVGRLKTQAGETEQDLFDAIRAVNNAHNPAFKIPDSATYVTDWPESFPPSDKQIEQMNDLALLNNNPPLMSREQFWRKWNPDLTEDALKKMAAEIDGEYAAGRQARAALFPRPAMAPTFLPVKGEDEDEDNE